MGCTSSKGGKVHVLNDYEYEVTIAMLGDPGVGKAALADTFTVGVNGAHANTAQAKTRLISINGARVLIKLIEAVDGIEDPVMIECDGVMFVADGAREKPFAGVHKFMTDYFLHSTLNSHYTMESSPMTDAWGPDKLTQYIQRTTGDLDEKTSDDLEEKTPEAKQDMDARPGHGSSDSDGADDNRVSKVDAGRSSALEQLARESGSGKGAGIGAGATSPAGAASTGSAGHIHSPAARTRGAATLPGAANKPQLDIREPLAWPSGSVDLEAKKAEVEAERVAARNRAIATKGALWKQQSRQNLADQVESRRRLSLPKHMSKVFARKDAVVRRLEALTLQTGKHLDPPFITAVPLGVLVNKIDTQQDRSQRAHLRHVCARWGEANRCSVTLTSAHTGYGVNEAFADLLRQIVQRRPDLHKLQDPAT